MNENYITLIKTATSILTQANVAAPVIFGVIATVIGAIKAIAGSGPSLAETADLITAQLGSNDAHIKAEIARLKSLAPPAPNA